MLALDVAFLPGEAGSVERRVAIVLDVLRASSTIVTLFDRDAASIGLAASVEAARAEAKRAPGETVLCGEVGGLPPYGFDFGNSPAEFAELDFGGKHVIMATTNGTGALRACAPAAATLVGALLNANAAIRVALEMLTDLEGVTMVCAGRQGRFVLDDAIAAGYLCHILLHEAKVRDLPLAASNAATAAYRLYHSYPNLTAALNDSDSGKALYPMRLGADVAYCAQTSITKRVPRLGSVPREGLYLL